MIAHELAVEAMTESCAALANEDIERAGEIIRTKYPHEKPLTLKKRKSFTKKEQLAIFLRDGFIDRYSGERLLFPGVLCVLSATLPDVFPYQKNWKADECHQGWYNLYPSIDHIVPLAFNGTNDENNLVSTSMKKNMAKQTSSLEEIGWKLHPPGKLEDWDGLLGWFMNYVAEHRQLLESSNVRDWYKAAKNFSEVEHG